MKRLIIAILLLISINSNSQFQRYYSYTQYHTEASYTETFNDTCKIVIEDSPFLRLIVISGKNLLEFIPIYDFRHEYTNILGMKSLLYNFDNNKNLDKLELLYQDLKLILVILTRKNKISAFSIYPNNDWL